MKTLVILTVALLYVGAVAAQYPAFLPGRRIKPRDAKPISELCTTSGRKSVCNEDTCAKGLVQCTGVGKGVEFDCGGSVPFCDVVDGVAKCVADAPGSCPAVVSENICLNAGIFPDLTNCKKFFVCTPDGAGDYYVDDYECDDQYVFDPTGRNGDYCRYTRNRYCVTLDCKGSTGNLLIRSYPGFRGQIGGTCRKDKNPIPFRCEENFNADLDTIPVECKLSCRGAGKFEYPEDNNKYYECIYNNNQRRWEAKVKSCFRNYYYDKSRRQCVVSPTTPPPRTTTAAVTTAAPETTAAGASTAAGGSTSAEVSTTAGAASTAAGGSTSAEVSTTAGAASTVAGVESTVAGVESTVAGVESTVAGVESTVAGVESTVAGVESTVAGDESTVAGDESTIVADTTTG